MKPRDVVAKAWEITNKEPQLRRWGFISAFLETLLNAKLLVYQVWFAYSYFILKDPIGFFTLEKVIMDALPLPLFIVLAIAFIVIIVFEWLFPHFARGAIIGLAAKSYRGEEVKGGLVLGVYNFFPLFGLHEMLVLSGVTTVVTLTSLALRYAGGAAPVLIMIIIAAWIFTNILEFFWIFAEEGLVITKYGVKETIGRSVKLVLSHLGHVVFIMLLLFFIILRIIANLLMIVIVPGVVLGVGYLLVWLLPSVPPAIPYSISGLLGIVIIFLASYFFAYLEVFRQTVWTITYLELNQLKDLDIIEDN